MDLIRLERDVKERLTREILNPKFQRHDPFGLHQGDLADAIGVSRKTLNEVLMERRSLSVDMAYCLGRLFNVSPGLLIRMQEAVDVWDTLASYMVAATPPLNHCGRSKAAPSALWAHRSWNPAIIWF